MTLNTATAAQLAVKRLPRILVVDDNRSIHRDFDLVLVDEAHNPELDADEQRTFGGHDRPNMVVPVFALDHAYSGIDGVQKVEQSVRGANPYQMAFVDIRMPGIDGVETIERIWKLDSRIQVVICTAYSDYSQLDLVQRLGFTDRLLVLRKPFDSIEVTQLAITLTEKWYLSVQAEMKLEQMEMLVAQRTQQLFQVHSGGTKVPPKSTDTESESMPDVPSEQELPAILLVESDQTTRRQIQRDLGDGFRVLEAANDGHEFELAREDVPDFVLANLADGQLCRRLKGDEMTSHIPVMLFSTGVVETEAIRALEAGADDYFVYPLNPHVFRSRVNRLLNRRRDARKQSPREASLNPRELADNQMDFQFLRRTIATIEQHMADFEFDIEMLSKKMFMSRRQFFRKVKAVTGCAPNLLIRNLRLKRAAQLLKESPMTVTEITYAVGFSDLKHFRAIFKEHFGVLPGEYAGHPDKEIGFGL